MLTNTPTIPLPPLHLPPRSLVLCFNEAFEFQESDIAAIAAQQRLTSLQLVNVSIPPGLDLQPLASGLQGLKALKLIQNSKVAPLLSGDESLAAIGAMVSIEDLELSGRMCGVGDGGLLALRGLVRLRRLVIGWVPWQSQISQVGA